MTLFETLMLLVNECFGYIFLKFRINSVFYFKNLQLKRLDTDTKKLN